MKTVIPMNPVTVKDGKGQERLVALLPSVLSRGALYRATEGIREYYPDARVKDVELLEIEVKKVL